MPRVPPPECTRWKPGQSGNPNGRPRRKRLTDELIRMLDCNEVAGEQLPNGMTFLQLIIHSLVGAVRNGDIKAISLIFDRVEGKASEEPAAAEDNPVALAIRDLLDRGQQLSRPPGKRSRAGRKGTDEHGPEEGGV